MRSLLTTLVALGACVNGSATPSVAPTATSASTAPAAARVERPTPKEHAIADTYAAAFAKSFAALGPSFENDGRAIFPGLPSAVGRDQVVALHELLFGAFDGRKLALRRVLKTSNAQVLEWTFSGEMARDWMQQRATHGLAAFEGVTLLFTTDEGAISDAHMTFDVGRVKAELGGAPRTLATLPPPQLPTSPPEIFEQTGSSAEAEDAVVVRTALDALEARDLPRYLSTMSDDVAISTQETAEPLRGKVAARAYFKAMHDSIYQLDTTIDNEWAVGAFVVVEYTVAGIQAAPIAWVPARPDRVVTLHVTDVVELRDERIARITRYDDPGEIANDEP